MVRGVRSTGPRLLPLVILLAVTGFQHVVAPTYGDFGHTGLMAPLGVMVQGADRGLVIALLAVGMTLIHRSNNIINFAQAEIGFVSATLASLLILEKGWSYYLAVVIGLVAAAVVGLVVEFVFVRRFFRAPRLILTVATIGIAQLMVAGSLGLNVAFSSNAFGGGSSSGNGSFFAPPVNLGFSIGLTNFKGDDVLILIVAPIVLVAVGGFLRVSAFGKGVRAAAERADRASLLGIPVKRLESLVWMLSSVLAFVALMLYIGNTGLPRGYPLGGEVLIMTIAAAVIGRFDDVATVVVAAVGLGVLNASLRYDWPDPAQRDFWLAMVTIVAVLAVRQHRGTRAGVVSSWQATREVRRIPEELRNVPEVRWTRIGLGIALAVFVVTLPVWLSPSRLTVATSIGVYSIVGISLVILTGWAGQVSLGQLALVALGGAATGTVTTRYHWDLSLALLFAAIVGAVALLIVGLPAIRAGGLALGITTLALALGVPYLLTENLAPWFLKDRLPRFDGDATKFRPRLFARINLDSDTRYYFFVLAMLALAILVARGLRRSRPGRVLIGLRENDRAARSYGVNPIGPYVTALVASGMLAGLAGGLTVTQAKGFFVVNEFNLFAGLGVFAMIVLGGLASISGAILGATYFIGIGYLVPADALWARFLATGIGLLVVLVLLPGGLGAAAGDGRDAGLRWVARRRGIRVPSLLADTLVDEPGVPAGAPDIVTRSESAAETLAVRR